MEKIETFLYDILGLCIPGLVVILTMEFKLNLISKTVNLLKDIPHCCMTFLYLTVFVIVCYITGSILKVISKYFYKIMQRIFDESINKIINTWKIKNLLESFIGKDLYELVAEIFVYKPQKFGSKFEPYYNKIKESIDIKKDKDNKEDNQKIFDYEIYKLAQIVTMNNLIKTNSKLFLAKYYLYKLLACWSFIYIFVVIIFHKNFLHPILLIIGLIITFFTFNEKYKLYKQLNGNELITALYYFYYQKDSRL